ncbi:gamma carbonic anhydrase family protein [Salibacterium salarium]|uniref:Gamma carbonic anhydrase family protein n=1 Tax=Salibacterium salarium TaxID=284579 RepID=A0A428MTK3_9BACI|nr:gamma carbonic anhydrase family protein [Salibacterium salarium]RSL29448.1 gamma carbonic anhydrase family protein [Salibacterium salarium]
MIYQYKESIPSIHESAFLSDESTIIGNVEIGEASSIWYNTVLRGDEGPIVIGRYCNIQENVTCHLYEEYPLTLEDEVSVGHNAIIHGCTLRKGSLVGMGAVVLDGAEVGEYSIIGAGSLIPPGKKIPPRSLVFGSPGKVVRSLTEEDQQMLDETIKTYTKKGQMYKRTDIIQPIERSKTNV